MTHQKIEQEARPDSGAGSPASRSINWYETLIYAGRIAAQHNVALDHRDLPIPGTMQWCGLPDGDARKLLALILGGVREALTNSSRQDAIADAGEAVWEAENWSQVAQQVQRRRQIDAIRRAS
ncbi:hypothetical protein BST23_01455 [Mycolicibacterium elephantis]|uniref:DUF2742 domain-containing protein n=1 Tax=Mycolicibacterium elephantis TaxID=81858 RepID=A0A1X0DAC7_9MYCO|nr:DUF2742 domain-containing protein [Mycolicibacterium elephantis]ORA69343.1 hypothetical protein BST23_01455 [Mycolicibacterium elephantis]